MKELIVSLFKQEPTNIKKITNGLTNENYYFEIDKQGYVIRIPSLHRPNNPDEEEILKQIKNLEINAEVIYYKDGVLITKFIENNATFKACNYKNKIELVAQTMKKLHQSNIQINHDFNIRNLFNHYFDQVKDIADKKVEEYHYLLDEVESFNNKKVLCHNDFVDGNMLFSNNKLYLIDYEYAGNNDPLFDVMSFLTENDIYDQESRDIFYNCYFEKIDDTLLNQLSCYEKLENMLWYYWTLMMYKNKKEGIYQDIAFNKLTRLFKQ